MSLRLRARLRGLSGVQAGFRRILLLGRPEIQERSLTAGAEVIATEARGLVHVRRGHLRDSIDVASSRSVGGAVGLSSGEVKVFVGPMGEHAFEGPLEEFGTVDTPAHPFMRPAIDNRRGDVFQAVADPVRVELGRLAR